MLTPPNSVQRTGAAGVWALPVSFCKEGRKTARPVLMVDSREAVRVVRVGASA